MKTYFIIFVLAAKNRMMISIRLCGRIFIGHISLFPFYQYMNYNSSENANNT